eukprot:scaffold16060_cov107-Isochrysis_galbana.AAC.10
MLETKLSPARRLIALPSATRGCANTRTSVQQLLPTAAEGRPRSNPVEMLDAMCHILWTGAPWRSLGKRMSTIHGTFTRWSRAHVFEKAYLALLKLDRRTTSRKSRFACIDSSFVKSIYGRDCIGRNPTDRGRNATKVSALVDQDGIPLSLVFFPGNVSDQKTVRATLSRAPKPSRLTPLYADKGYDSKENRNCCAIGPFLSRCLDPDRDELSCMQMLIAGAQGMCSGSRPAHLRSGTWRKRRLG